MTYSNRRKSDGSMLVTGRNRGVSTSWTALSRLRRRACKQSRPSRLQSTDAGLFDVIAILWMVGITAASVAFSMGWI